MPKESPTAQQVFNGEISFCSIDTDLIQAKAFSFSEGQLNLLSQQVPANLEIVMTEVVQREILDHRISLIKEDVEKLKNSIKNLKKKGVFDFAGLKGELDDVRFFCAIRERFCAEIQGFLSAGNGCVLRISDADPQTLLSIFEDYFSLQPPFDSNKEKKHEFPDALSLALLEQYAEDQGKKGVVVSGDKGWKSYAESSDNLYYLASIEDLANLFTSTSEIAGGIKRILSESMGCEGSRLYDEVKRYLQGQVDQSDIDLDGLYNGSFKIDADADWVSVIGLRFPGDAEIWERGEEVDGGIWSAKIDAMVTVEICVEISFYGIDPFDGDDVCFSHKTSRFQQDISVPVFLRCSGINLGEDPKKWEVEIEADPISFSIPKTEVFPIDSH